MGLSAPTKFQRLSWKKRSTAQKEQGLGSPDSAELREEAGPQAGGEVEGSEEAPGRNSLESWKICCLLADR
jgi:hypothetical protein